MQSLYFILIKFTKTARKASSSPSVETQCGFKMITQVGDQPPP